MTHRTANIIMKKIATILYCLLMKAFAPCLIFAEIDRTSGLPSGYLDNLIKRKTTKPIARIDAAKVRIIRSNKIPPYCTDRNYLFLRRL